MRKHQIAVATVAVMVVDAADINGHSILPAKRLNEVQFHDDEWDYRVVITAKRRKAS